MNSAQILNRLNNMSGIVEANLTQREKARVASAAAIKQLQSLKELEKVFVSTIEYLQQKIASNRQAIYNAISKLVNYGLTEVFGHETEFRIESDTYGDSPSCRFQVRTEGYPEWVDIDRKQEEHGNGLVVLISFLLKIVIHRLKKNMPNYMIMDEPFAELSKGYIEALGNLLKQSNKVFGIQFIIITHNDDFASYADQIIKTEK